AGIQQEQKYIKAPQPEFYNLKTDPSETKNIVQNPAAQAVRDKVELYARNSTGQKSSSMSEEDMEKLRSLGYIGGALPESNIEPNTKIGLMEKFEQAMNQLKGNDYAQAEAEFQQFTKSEPHNCVAFSLLADSLSAQKKYADAAAAYSASVNCLPDPAV